MSRDKKLLKNTIIYAIGNISSKFLIFLFLPIYTKFLTPSEFGTYDLIVTIVALMVPIISFQIQEAVFRYIIDENSSRKRNQVISSAFQIAIRNISLTNIVYIAVVYLFNIKYSILIMLYFNVYIISELYLQVARGLKKNKEYATAGVINTFSNVFSIILLLIILHLKIEALLISVILGFLISIGYLEIKLKLIKKVNFFKWNSVMNNQLLSYSIPLIPNILNWWIMNVSDRLLLNYYIGIEANGIYAVANKFPSMLFVMSSIFYLAWQESSITEFESKDRDSFYTKMFNGYMKFQFSCLFILLSCSYILMYFFVDNQFKDAYFYMPFLFLGAIFSAFSSFYGTGFQSSKETKGSFYSSVVGSIINIILNIILIPMVGVQGAAIATMLAFLSMWIMRIKQTKKYFRIQLDYKTLISLTIITLIFMVIYFNVESELIRITTIILSIVIAGFYNKNLLNLVFNKGYLRRTQ